MTSTTPVAKAAGRPSLTGTPNSAVGATMFDNSKNSPGGEGVLQNFFNSLLNRKSVSGASPGGVSSAAGRTPNSVNSGAESLRNRDVQAELNRLSGGGNMTTESNTSQASINESQEDKTQQ